MELVGDTLFHLLYWAGWATLGVILVGIAALLGWLVDVTYLRPPAKRPGRRVDYRREDVE